MNTPSSLRFAILLSTCNGSEYLEPLLASLAEQEHTAWDLYIRDDGSEDDTPDQLHRFSEKLKQHQPANKVSIVLGSRAGVVPSFFTLLARVPDGYDGYAFCDQDDIWNPEKLRLAARRLMEYRHKESTTDKACLYHARQLVTDAQGRVTGMSPEPVRAGLANAAIQNQVTGCTMVLNRRLRSLVLEGLERGKSTLGEARPNRRPSDETVFTNPEPEPVPAGIIMHDWWCYLVASAQGTLCYESRPVLRFRRHAGNSTPLSAGIAKAWITRAQAMRNRSWSLQHIFDQAHLYLRLYPTAPRHAVVVLHSLTRLREACLLERLRYLIGGVHVRTRLLETLAFRILIVIRRY